MKFGMLVHLEPDDSQMTNYDWLFLQFKMVDNTILKVLFGHNSADDCQISVEFCEGRLFSTEFW